MRTLLILILGLSVSCALVSDNPFPSDLTIPTDLEIKLSRKACKGTCPIYDLTIKADGTVLFDGKKHTKVIGTATDKISEDKVRELVKVFKDAGYFGLRDSYFRDGPDCPDAPTDFPSAHTSININGKQKTIQNYFGCKVKQLVQLENSIDNIASTFRWVK